MPHMILHTSRLELRRQGLGLVCLGVALMGLCAGCAGKSIQADNPVLASTPPRMKLDAAALAKAESSKQTAAIEGDIKQASFTDSPLPTVNEDSSGVAATVNGIPILIADVLERFTPQLEAAKKQLPESEFAKLKRQLIKRELPMHVEQAILVDSALSQLKAEQRELVDQQLDTIFAEDLKNIQAEMGANSLAELEAILQQAGTSITNLQRSFNNRQLAGQAMGLLTPKEPTISRGDLLEEYQRRLDEFTTPEQVKWQQVWISYKKHGGKQQALDALDVVVQALRSGQSFDAVAREHSDGAMAADGGHWDWTERGVLTNEEIERMLFELPVGEFGKVVAGEKAFQIVRVTERKPRTTKTFAEMQEQLGQEIKQKKQQDLLQKVVAELKAEAVITTMFDDEETADEQSVRRHLPDIGPIQALP